MRGLPRIPDEVASYRMTFIVSGHELTSSVWVFIPGLPTLTDLQLRDLLSIFVFWTTPLVDNCCGTDCVLARVALLPRGRAAGEVEEVLLPTPGRWTGQQFVVATCTLHLVTDDPDFSRAAIIHLPGVPDVFTDHLGTITPLGYGNLQAYGRDFLNGISGVPSPAGGVCVAGVVHRSRAGAPLPAAVFSPALGVRAGLRVGVLRRRRPARR